MQPSFVFETCRRQSQGKNIVEGMPLCPDLSSHASAHCLPAALTPIRIAPAAVPARTIRHVLSVAGNLLRQSHLLQRRRLGVVTSRLLLKHAVRVCARPIGGAKIPARARVPILLFFG